jgi:hypothetical protein
LPKFVNLEKESSTEMSRLGKRENVETKKVMKKAMSLVKVVSFLQGEQSPFYHIYTQLNAGLGARGKQLLFNILYTGAYRTPQGRKGLVA